MGNGQLGYSPGHYPAVLVCMLTVDVQAQELNLTHYLVEAVSYYYVASSPRGESLELQ